jgi:hypothetical protein
MNRWRSFGFSALATLLLAIGQALLAPFSAAASAGSPPPVPIEIAVTDAEFMFSRHARGVQVYECQNGQWVLHAPRAVLFDSETHGAAGFHYGGIDRDLAPGPWWESKDDGSRILGVRTGSAPSPNPDSIPLLRLAVQDRSGNGEFSSVTRIQRLNTEGGVSPTGACESGMQRDVPYTADYYFYGNP